MIWLDVIGIIGRILFGLIAIGFVLGLFLHEKHKIFKNIFEFTGFCAVWYGVAHMFIFAISGS